MSTIPHNSKIQMQQRGNAALEALMLIVILILPMWMLLFNMGYAGGRLRDSQVAASLAGHLVVEEKTKGNAIEGNQKQAIQKKIENKIFKGESNTVKLTVVQNSITDEFDEVEGDDPMGALGALLDSLSGHTEIKVQVERISPFDMFEPTPTNIDRTVAGTPYTYCEMKNARFDPLSGTADSGMGLGILSLLKDVVGVILGVFGGYPFGDNKC